MEAIMDKLPANGRFKIIIHISWALIRNKNINLFFCIVLSILLSYSLVIIPYREEKYLTEMIPKECLIQSRCWSLWVFREIH